MTNEEIKNLESKGFKRWQKGAMDRLYISPKYFGLKVEYYKTGNVRSAELNGSLISNSEARRILGGKYYVDLATENIVVQTHSYNAEKIKNLIEAMISNKRIVKKEQ